ncbi:MAG: hypothetical protein IJH04_06385, partial [Eggerthellaceae bacterium]|nr:hypothetical protein [Eggerthellaceae bacterium]
MKPTQITELLANIRNTFVSFFSILMFVALGVGIFVGIQWTSPALQDAAERVFDDGSFHNIQVTYPYGLTADDLEALKGIEGVSEVEASRQVFARYSTSSGLATFKLQTLSDTINTPNVIEGTLPTQPNELALKNSTATHYGLHVGDTITFMPGTRATDASSSTTDSDSKSSIPQLKNDTFKITALIETAEFLAFNNMTFGMTNIGSGEVEAIAWLPASSFVDSAYHDGFTTVNVRSKSLAGMGTFSDEYRNASLAIEKRISELGDDRAPTRYDALHTEAQKAIDDGEAQLAEAEQKIAEGETAITQGTAQLEEARVTLDQTLAQGQAQLESAYQQLMDGEDLKTVAENQLAEAQNMLSFGQQALSSIDAAVAAVTPKANAAAPFLDTQNATLKQADDEFARAKQQHDAGTMNDADFKAAQARHDQAAANYNSALDTYAAKIAAELEPYAQQAGVTVPAIDHTNFSQAITTAQQILSSIEDQQVTFNGQTFTVREARAKVAELASQVASGQTTLSEKVAELEAGWAQYYSGQQQLESARAEGEQKIADGQTQLDSVIAQVADGKAQVEEKKPQLEQAKAQLSSMTEYDWSVVGRSYNGGVTEVATLSAVTKSLSLSMAALFVIVGLLVSYSAVSRIVHEQIVQIGTKKALGLRGREITASFMAYSALAVLIGAILGLIVGVTAVESIIGATLGKRFIMGSYPAYFGVPLAVGITLIELVLIEGTTWLACRRIPREHAVELLKGEKPPMANTRFYEKWGIWDKLPLFTQTIVNNCINDKRRVFSTIVGVAGCTALIVTAITLNDDVLESYDAQYRSIYGFNDIAFVDPEVIGAADAVEAKLEDLGANAVQSYRSSYSATLPDGERVHMRMFVPTDEEGFASFYQVNAVSGEPFDPDSESVWVTQAYANHCGAKVGDELVLGGLDGSTHRFTIAGFYEFYLTYHEVVMGPKAYRAAFGSAPVANVVIADMGDVSLNDAAAAL